MRPAAAFAIGLWTGALVTGAGGVFYFRLWQRNLTAAPPQAQEQIETRIRLLQQEQARAAAETQRLRETVAELRSSLARQSSPSAAESTRGVRPLRSRDANGTTGVEAWILDSVRAGDAPALLKLEQAAQQNNQLALDALALLADRDNAEALSRTWASAALSDTSRGRATMLLAATAEVNPRAEELLQSLAGSGPGVLEAVLTGLGSPEFSTRLTRGTGIEPPPHFKPDYALRLRIADSLRTGVTEVGLLEAIDRVRSKLAQRASGVEAPAR